jgi:spermidine/putrescine transport system permease protein
VEPAQRKTRTGYFLLLPGIAWLAIFFAIPLVTLFVTSLQKPIEGKPGKYAVGFEIGNYWQAIAEYWPLFVRSFVFAGIATALALVISYPLAYFIAFKSGRWSSLLLVLVIAPLCSTLGFGWSRTSFLSSKHAKGHPGQCRSRG